MTLCLEKKKAIPFPLRGKVRMGGYIIDTVQPLPNPPLIGEGIFLISHVKIPSP